MDDTEEANVDGEGGSGMCEARKIGDLGSLSRHEGNRSVENSSTPLPVRLWGDCAVQIPCARGSGGSLFHWMAASSSLPGERFGRPNERLEERREEGEQDLTEEAVEPLLLNTDVMIRNEPDVGRLVLPPVFSEFASESGKIDSAPLSLWPKIEGRLWS